MKDKLRIWYFHNYTMLPEHGPLNRGYYLGKYLKRLGYEPVVFAGSHPHNTDLQLIEDKRPYKIYQKKPFPWVLIKTKNYGNSKKKQIVSMFEFYRNAWRAVRYMQKPDVIVGSSAHPLAALLAIRLARRYHCKGIIEIRDFWPESIVTYGICSRNNPLIKLLYEFEKYLYVRADMIILTMENGYAYFEDHGLDQIIDRSKVHYLNNGVDLEEFEYNKWNYQLEDKDLENKDVFKVVYAGAIRHVNNVGKILDIAKECKKEKIMFLIYGAGDEVDKLKQRLIDEEITNVVFKGRIDKKYIPYIVSKADLNLMDMQESNEIFKYGISPNKLFEYFAAKKPVLMYQLNDNNPALEYGVGFVANNMCEIKKIITGLLNGDEEYFIPEKKFEEACKTYSYEELTKRFIEILER